MKTVFKKICLFVATISLVVACSKKTASVSPDNSKDKLKTKLAEDKDKKSAPTDTRSDAKSEAKTDTQDTDVQGDIAKGPKPDPAPDTKPIPAKPPSTVADPKGSLNPAPPPAESKLITGPASTTKLDAAVAKVPNATADQAAIEKCFREQADKLLTNTQNADRKIKSAVIIQDIKIKIKDFCKKDLQEESDLNLLLTKIVTEQSNALVPGSEPILALFNAVENKKMKQDERNKIYAAADLSAQIQSKSIVFTGDISQPPDKDNVVIYTLRAGKDSGTGELVITTQTLNKEVKVKRILPDEVNKKGTKYTFNFGNSPGQQGQIVITEGETKKNYEFVFTKGDLSSLKAKSEVTIIFTQESWNSILEARQKSLFVQEVPELMNYKFQSTKEPNDPKLSRTCTLTITGILCRDPDYITRSTIDPASLMPGP